MQETNESVIRIPLEDFLHGNLGTRENVYIQKAATMRATYRCFDPSSNAMPKSWRAISPRRPQHMRIGETKDSSRESIARRDFLALMNKLTPQNQNAILQTLKHVFREDSLHLYLQIIWDSMQRAPDFLEVYVHVLQQIYQLVLNPQAWREQWGSLWKAYLEQEIWVPSAAILLEEDYDEFCDFLAWKKRAMASIRAWKELEKNGWISQVDQQMIPRLCNKIEKCRGNGKECDVFLDQLLLFIPSLSAPMVMSVKTWTKTISEDGWKPSSRFKFMDVKEKIEEKMNVKLPLKEKIPSDGRQHERNYSGRTRRSQKERGTKPTTVQSTSIRQSDRPTERNRETNSDYGRFGRRDRHW